MNYYVHLARIQSKCELLMCILLSKFPKLKERPRRKNTLAARKDAAILSATSPSTTSTAQGKHADHPSQSRQQWPAERAGYFPTLLRSR